MDPRYRSLKARPTRPQSPRLNGGTGLGGAMATGATLPQTPTKHGQTVPIPNAKMPRSRGWWIWQFKRHIWWPLWYRGAKLPPWHIWCGTVRGWIPFWTHWKESIMARSRGFGQHSPADMSGLPGNGRYTPRNGGRTGDAMPPKPVMTKRDKAHTAARPSDPVMGGKRNKFSGGC